MKLLVGVLAVLLLWSVPAGAQQKPGLHVIVEELSQDASTCGIGQSSIESIAALTLRNNGIHVVANSNPYFYVQATVMAVQSASGRILRCDTNIYVTVQGISSAQGAMGGFKSRQGYGKIVFCSSSGLSSDSVSEAGHYVLISLENHIKLCLGELEY